MELLEIGSLDDALNCLKKFITPRSEDTTKLCHLARLVTCKDKSRLFENGKGHDDARLVVLSEILKLVSPDKIMDSGRLETLIQQAMEYQISNCKYHNIAVTDFSLMKDHQCKYSKVPSVCVKTLTLHNDEIWQVNFSSDGKYFATVSKDQIVIVWSISKDISENLIRIHAVLFQLI